MSDDPGFSPFSGDGVQIVPVLSEGVLRITMSGSVEMRDPGAALNPFWEDVDARAFRMGIERIEVDMSGVSFMNSSGLLTLVRWITRVRDRVGGAGYRMTFHFDENVTWQRTNVPILARLAPDSVSLERIP